MNSKAAQLRENGTEIVRLFGRFALGASFLSAVADRFGLWGPYGAKNVSWGNFAHFVEYTGAMTSLFPSSLTVSFAWAATLAETLFGILLIAGFKIRMASVLSGLLLLSFAIGMATGLGIKSPFDYSVFSAAAAAFLLAFWEPDRFTLDKLLDRLRNSAGDRAPKAAPTVTKATIILVGIRGKEEMKITSKMLVILLLTFSNLCVLTSR